jgi:hypothetical protein
MPTWGADFEEMDRLDVTQVKWPVGFAKPVRKNMTKKKRIRTGSAKSMQAHKGTRRIGPKSSHTEIEPLHQPDYLLEDHPELGIPLMEQNVGSPKKERRAKK